MSGEKRFRYHGPVGMMRYQIPEPDKNDVRFVPGVKTVTEAQREVKVISEADVVVVGGGPGGFASASGSAAWNSVPLTVLSVPSRTSILP